MVDPAADASDSDRASSDRASSGGERCDNRRSQAWELAMLTLMYLLQVSNAEMLRRVSGAGLPAATAIGDRSLVEWGAFALVGRVHPLAMLVTGTWQALLGLLLLRGRTLPRWALDAPGLWFSVRLTLEFLTINGLIFAGSGRVNSSVLLGQIIVYLPYFVVTWGWIFHRIDRVGQSQSGRIVALTDIDASHSLNAFDYYYASVTTILNRSKPTISGISRRGRVLVLIHQLMLMALYAVAFARLLQLAQAAV